MCSKQKCALCLKYPRYLHKTNITNITMLIATFAIKQAIKKAEVHLSSTINMEINLTGYVIYSSADANCQQSASMGKQITQTLSHD